MLPIRLQVHNFMCYRGDAPVLDFTGIHLACLCGDNGHGKSAILDAVTWALWGRCRADNNDDIVHAGASEMEVTLDFYANEGRHRVVRKYAKPRARSRSGQSSLQLQLWNGQAYTAQSGDSIRDTQAQIIALMRLSYDTFVNSAFLLQGKADLFTMAPAAKRKEVLGEILSLAFYDGLAERARFRRSDADSKVKSLDFLLSEADKDIAGEEDIRASLAAADEAASHAKATLQVGEDRLRVLQDKEVRLSYLEQQMADLRPRLARVQADKAQADAVRAQGEKRLAVYKAVLSKEAEIAGGYARLLDARQKFQDQGSKAARYAQVSAEKAGLEKEIDRNRTLLDSELRWVQSQAEEARAASSGVGELNAEKTRLEESLQALVSRERDLEAARAQAQEAVGSAQSLKETNRALRQQMDELKEKLDWLTEGGKEAACPLCGTPLGADGMQHIRREYEGQGKALGEQYRANQARLVGMEKEQQRAGTRAREMEADIQRDRSRMEQRLALVRREMDQAAQAARKLEEMEQKASSLLAQDIGKDYARAEQVRLVQVQADLDALGYSHLEHRRQEEAVRALAPFEQRHRELEDAHLGLDREEEAVRLAASAVERLHQEETELSAQLAALTRDLADRDAVRREAQQARQSVEQRRRERDAATEKATFLKAELERLERRRAQQANQRQERQRAADEFEVYNELVTAFGKRGVQALLIENAVPQIEQEANELLRRMTDGRMSVQLQTLGSTKAGDQRETLEIIIGDEWSTRPYEMYSGGEKFRIDLALRIGLSRLLARRAGAPLPVLFIDEGFGTQDARGRERIVDTISAIQDEFQLILVITHIEDLKEMFPVRIEVEKNGEGSTFSVVV